MTVLALAPRSARADLELHINIWAVVVMLALLAGFAVLSVVLCLDRLKDQRQQANGHDIDVGRRGRRWLRWHGQHKSEDKLEPSV